MGPPRTRRGASLVLLLVAGLVTTVVLGLLAYEDGRRRELAEAGRFRAHALVVSSQVDGPQPGHPVPTVARAEIRWRDRDGRLYTARRWVPRGTPAGSTLSVWTDGRGSLVGRTATLATTGIHVALTVISALTVTVAIVAAGSAVVRHLERRRRLVEWEKEWIRLAQNDTSDDHR